MAAGLKSDWLPGMVIENRQWTERLFSLRIDVEQRPFTAGQFVRLRLPVDGELIEKSYSLVNASMHETLEVFFNIVPEGKLSSALAAVRKDDSVEVSQPAMGFFTLPMLPDTDYLWMFASGTGLGPYLSLLNTDTLWERFRRIVLVHGAPLLKELAYRDFIEQQVQKHAGQLKYVSCVTREQNPSGLHGRMTTLLDSGELEEYAGLPLRPENSHVMLCGNHGMIRDMQKLLADRGMKSHQRHAPGHVTIEQYY